MIDLRDLAGMEIIFYPKDHLAYSGRAFPQISCIYFLFLGDRVVYIGETKNLRKRMSQHLSPSDFKNFDRIGYIEVEDDKEKRLDFEAEFTEKYLSFIYPPYDLSKDFYYNSP